MVARNDAVAEPEQPLSQLWYTRCPVPTATGVALDQGWLAGEFSRTGVALKSLLDTTDPDFRLSHFSHTLAGLFREGGNIPAIWAKARGEETTVVGLTWVDETQVLLVKEDSPIRSAEDLAGARLGLSIRPGETIDFGRAMALHGYVSALSLGGLTAQDGQFVEIPGPPTSFGANGAANPWRDPSFDALLNGEIDAVYIKGAPAVALREKFGLRVAVDLNEAADPAVRINNGTPRPITVNRDLVETRPDLVARYLAILLLTADWARDFGGEVRRIVAAETSTDIGSVEAAYGPKLHQSLRPSLRADWVDALEVQKNFLRDWHFLAGDFDVRDWISPGPLAEAEKLVASGAIALPGAAKS